MKFLSTLRDPPPGNSYWHLLVLTGPEHNVLYKCSDSLLIPYFVMTGNFHPNIEKLDTDISFTDNSNGETLYCFNIRFALVVIFHS